jgi:hypothetical protein
VHLDSRELGTVLRQAMPSSSWPDDGVVQVISRISRPREGWSLGRQSQVLEDSAHRVRLGDDARQTGVTDGARTRDS